MEKNKLRMFLEIKNKENKTELEELYLALRSYNFIAGELCVSWSKGYLNIKDFYNRRKENFLKYTNAINLMSKYEEIKEEMKKIIVWDLENITFEQLFILEFENAKVNIQEDIIYMRCLEYV